MDSGLSESRVCLWQTTGGSKPRGARADTRSIHAFEDSWTHAARVGQSIMVALSCKGEGKGVIEDG